MNETNESNTEQPSAQPEQHEQREQPARQPALVKLPPFSLRRLRWKLAMDLMLRVAVFAVAAVALAAILWLEQPGTLTAAILVGAIVAGWMWIGSVNSKVLAHLDRLLIGIEQDPDQAEQMLAQLMQQRGLMRWVRLLLYQRLALLRHRQQRHAEAAAIARSVLAYPLGPAEAVRASLLLLLVEADLKTQQVPEAYQGLCGLAMMPLPLVEQIQRMALQTQYEVMLGHDGAALHDVRRKVALAELMPPAQCGAWHAQMAEAARRAQQSDLAAWLSLRAQLMGAVSVTA